MTRLEGIVSKYLPSNLKRIEQYKGYVKKISDGYAEIIINYKSGELMFIDSFPFESCIKNCEGKKPIEVGDRVVYTAYRTKYGKIDAIIEIKPAIKTKLTKKERKELNMTIDTVLSQK